MSQTVLQKLKLPLILLVVLLFPLFFGEYFSEGTKSVLFAVSLSMKNILLFVLPFIIFSFLFSCLTSLRGGVIAFVLLLVACVFISNITAITIGYSVGYTALSIWPTAPQAMSNVGLLEAAWNFELPKLIANEAALILGFVFGMFFSIKRNYTAQLVAGKLNFAANYFLRRIFIPVLPIFILGFVFKLEHDQLLGSALKFYAPILLLVVGTQVFYICFLYLAAAGFSFSKFAMYMRNLFPAAITGFSTISSAASMPVLIISTEKNTNDPALAEMVVPATINIHTLGSAIGLTILVLATLLTFNMPLPPPSVFFVFAFFYAIAKYAVAAVPGGVIIIATPLLEAYLGFSPEMLGLITAVYMIFDPFGTATNVSGNGAFPIIFKKIYRLVVGKDLTGSSEQETKTA